MIVFSVSAVARAGVIKKSSEGVQSRLDSNNNADVSQSQCIRPDSQSYTSKQQQHSSTTPVASSSIPSTTTPTIFLPQTSTTDSFLYKQQQQTTPPALGGTVGGFSDATAAALAFGFPLDQQLAAWQYQLGQFHQQQQLIQQQRSVLGNAVAQNSLLHNLHQQQQMALAKKNRLALLDADNLTEKESIAVAVLADFASCG